MRCREEKKTEVRDGLLFIKLAEQGSTVLASAAIRDAVKRHGRERVYFLLLENNRFVLDVLGLVPKENIFEIETGSLGQMFRSVFFCWRRVVGLRLRECVDLEFFSRLTAVFAFLTGIPSRSGFHCWYGEGPWRGNLLTHRVRYNPHLHTQESFRLLTGVFAEPPAELPRVSWHWEDGKEALPKFEPTEEEQESVRKMLEELFQGREYRNLILLNPNASDLLPLRKWDSENYIVLAKRLLEKDGALGVIFTGSEMEAEEAMAMAQAVGSERAVSVAGKTTLRELLALYYLADVLVTNDSGPAHFSALTPIRAVVLYGPETPELFGPISGRATVLGGKTLCSPCVSALNHRQTKCRDNLCMRLISVEEVVEAVRYQQEFWERKGC